MSPNWPESVEQDVPLQGPAETGTAAKSETGGVRS